LPQGEVGVLAGLEVVACELIDEGLDADVAGIFVWSLFAGVGVGAGVRVGVRECVLEDIVACAGDLFFDVFDFFDEGGIEVSDSFEFGDESALGVEDEEVGAVTSEAELTGDGGGAVEGVVGDEDESVLEVGEPPVRHGVIGQPLAVDASG